MPPPRSVFTSHERAALKDRWGSQSTRLTRDSFLPFGSCQLCLLSAEDPVVCPSGDLFCRECAMTNLLAQRKEMKRVEKAAERSRVEEEEERVRDEAEADARAVREFEIVQAGLEGSVAKSTSTSTPSTSNPTPTPTTDHTPAAPQPGTKRKFALSTTPQDSLTADRAKASRTLASERAASKQHLPSFWVPAETPTTHHAAAAAPKKTPTCPAAAADAPHALSLKTLTSVQFTEEAAKDASGSGGGSAGKKTRTCPACSKALSNASRAVVAIPCGHVLCAPCVARFLKPELRHHRDAHDEAPEPQALHCYVCDADLGGKDKEGRKEGKGKKEREKEGVKAGLVEIRSEGTGYASAGQSLVKREGVAFQV